MVWRCRIPCGRALQRTTLQAVLIEYVRLKPRLGGSSRLRQQIPVPPHCRRHSAALVHLRVVRQRAVQRVVMRALARSCCGCTARSAGAQRASV